MRRVVALLGLLLSAARAAGDDAPRLRFGWDVPPADARRLEARTEEAWRDWSARYGPARAPADAVTVESADPASMPGEAGRQRDGRILLSRLLTRPDAETVLLHELAHLYVATRCPDLARAAPVASEAFALLASGDAARRTLADERFPFAAQARDFLAARESTVRGHEPDAQAALSRVLSQPGADASWEAWFKKTLDGCGDRSFAPSLVHAGLFERIRAVPRPTIPARFDFLLVEGPSQRTLAREGRVDDDVPAGSVLKPSLVALVPALMEPRPSRDAPEWHCPGPPEPGEAWTWQRALARSCNGFFLDFVPPGAGAFHAWEETLRLSGMRDVPSAMPGRIGLTATTRLSPTSAVRLFSWLATTAPFVVEALRDTPRDGTLSGAADAAWFAERGIALKSGTVRDSGSTPHHAWIVAVGPRLPSGEPAFVAALHGTGLAAPALLPHLRERLERAPRESPATARVQILGLAPLPGVTLSCDDGVPLALRDADGSWRLLPPGSTLVASELTAGTRVGCLAAPLAVSCTGSRGSATRRRYAGWLDVDPPPGTAPVSSVPLRERSARARSGSRLVLSTSVREYVASTLLSEHAGGSPEVLKALALVVRHDLLVTRHDGRPPCDTTHCHLFGQEADGAARQPVEQAIDAVASLRLETGGSEPAWLPFEAGGEEPWSRRVAGADVRSRLALASGPREIHPLGDGNVAVDGKTLPCELLRNQLRLPSCPDRIGVAGDGFELSGRGEGHGEGMDLAAAERAAAKGATFRDLLARFYPPASVVER